MCSRSPAWPLAGRRVPRASVCACRWRRRSTATTSRIAKSGKPSRPTTFAAIANSPCKASVASTASVWPIFTAGRKTRCASMLARSAPIGAPSRGPTVFAWTDLEAPPAASSQRLLLPRPHPGAAAQWGGEKDARRAPPFRGCDPARADPATSSLAWPRFARRRFQDGAAPGLSGRTRWRRRPTTQGPGADPGSAAGAFCHGRLSRPNGSRTAAPRARPWLCDSRSPADRALEPAGTHRRLLAAGLPARTSGSAGVEGHDDLRRALRWRRLYARYPTAADAGGGRHAQRQLDGRGAGKLRGFALPADGEAWRHELLGQRLCRAQLLPRQPPAVVAAALPAILSRQAGLPGPRCRQLVPDFRRRERRLAHPLQCQDHQARLPQEWPPARPARRRKRRADAEFPDRPGASPRFLD